MDNKLINIVRLIGLIISFFFLMGVPQSFAQNNKAKGEKIQLLDAVYMGINKKIDQNAKAIVGNVKLQQGDVFMYCDSVYLYAEENNFKAFGNVHLVKGDSIEVYSDTLYHFGNQKLSKFRGNVVMNDQSMKLYTDSLNYDMLINQAYYMNGGRIIDSASTLVSKIGRYFTNREVFYFQDSVVVSNDKMVLNTDILEYHSKSNMAYFEGPTTMVSDTNHVYAEHGWYDMGKEFGHINKNVRYTNQHQTLDCDTLIYHKKDMYAEAFSNVVLRSLKDSAVLTSNYVFYNEANQSAIATDSATMIQISASDTTYLHADTLRSYIDTASGIRNIFGYYHVQLFGNSVQMRCDSIAFSFADSTVRLFGQPVIWSDSSQLKALNIQFRIVDNELKEVYLKENAIIISQNDSLHYNQIKGFEITGFLELQKLKKAVVNRRSETIYYLEDENTGELSGMNKTRCRQMNIYFKNGLAERVVWLSEPVGQVLPMEQLNGANMYFNEFEWLDFLRPQNRFDIYNWQNHSSKIK